MWVVWPLQPRGGARIVAPMGEDRCRVMVNDRCLRNPTTGVGRYVTELLAGLAEVAPEVETWAFYSWLRRREVSRAARETDAAEIPPPVGLASASRGMRPPHRSPDWMRRCMQGAYDAVFAFAGTAAGYRLYHEPNHIPMPWDGPIVTTVHDVSVLRHPAWHPADRVAWYERDFAAGVARTTHFIAVSEFTKREMVELAGIDAGRISVVPLGVRAAFSPRPVDEVAAWCRSSGGVIVPGYLLYVGTIEPRKNVPGLIEAYARQPATLRTKHPLVIAGMAGWGQQEVLTLAERHGVAGDVRVLGYVADAALPMLYNAAAALVWPTLYEGFGLPPLEAMACGTPVISSDAASVPEVVGDAGVLVNPYDSSALAEAMRVVLEDGPGRERLRAAGLARAAAFTWSACARRHGEIYRLVERSK